LPEGPRLLAFRLEQEGGRLDRLVADALPDFSRSRVQALIRGGHVQVDGVVRKGSHRPDKGAQVTVNVPPTVAVDLEPVDLGLTILHRDPHLAVVVKPAGLVVHPAPSHHGVTLVHGLVHVLEGLSSIGGEARPGIVHRLDKGTSGVMVVACNDVAHRGLQEQFADHSLDRRYLALVSGTPDLDAGTVRSNLGRHPHDRLRFASVEGKGKRAVTHWKIRERLGRVTLMECRLETGRTHQVRVHLSEQGWPLLGDPVYAKGRAAPPELSEKLDGVDHQLLHAYRLAFTHPVTGEDLSFETDIPADFQGVLDLARQGHSEG
jgi:23S rRNA pseudouridine1911/1915/1917 synthase